MVELLDSLCLSEDIQIDADPQDNYVSSIKNESTEADGKLSVVRKLLLFFLQQNFVGCRRQDMPAPSSPAVEYRQRLEIDSEQLNVNVRNPELLWTAKQTLKEIESSPGFVANGAIYLVWKLRSILIHQHVLDERTGGLYVEFKTVVQELEPVLEGESVFVTVCVALEIVQGFILFKRVTEASEYLARAKAMLDTEMKLVSMLGYRTRFQQTPLPQLALSVTTNLGGLAKSSVTHSATELPKLLLLEDDTRLEKVKFVNEEFDQIDDLPSLIQCLIISQVQLMEIGQARDNLLEEELKAYVTTLLYQDNGPWAVRFATLLANIKMEANHKRTVERSLKQCEDLMKLVERSPAPLAHRVSMFFCSGMAPIWVTEVQLGSLMLSLGFVKTALEVFIRIQSWEEVIGCYNTLSLRHKAEEIIRQELEKNPTDRLYCMLGDATDDVSFYEKAWEVSEHRSACAQRHWGNYLFAKKEFPEAICHLERSLEINSLQELLWLKLGYAALETENWPLAAKAYNRYTQLEPNGFESWNNLAKAYIKMGDKKRAHKILYESLKCNFNNWKVWENFMLVSLDTGNFEDVLNAYKQLLDLKPAFADKEVLKLLIESIEMDRLDAKGVGAARLRKRAATLLGGICSKHLGDGFYWELAAKLYNEELLMKTQKLQKALSAHGQGQNKWNKNPVDCRKMIELSTQLAEDSLKMIETDTSALAVSQLSSSRMAVQGCSRAAAAENHEECRVILADLNVILEELTAKTKEFMLAK